MRSMSADETLIERILGGSHAKAVLTTVSWGLKTIYGVVTILAFACFIVNITKLALSSGNPQARKEALRGILISGSCIAALGSIGLIFVAVISFW